MKLILVIIAVMWAYSMYKFRRKMKYFSSITKFYEMKHAMNPNDVIITLGLASAYMQIQRYRDAYAIYEQLCAKGLGRAPGYGEAIRANMEFCKCPIPGSKGPKNYNKSWWHNFVLVRLGSRHQFHFSEDDILEAESLIRKGVI